MKLKKLLCSFLIFLFVVGFSPLTEAPENISDDNDLSKVADFPPSPHEGQTFWDSIEKKPYWYDKTNTRWRTYSDAATLVIAASDSQNPEKAEYICDGNTDDQVLSNALATLPSNGGELKLLEGKYYLHSDLTLDASSQLSFTKGAILVLDPGITLTINGPVLAATAQIFSGDGSVVWNNGQAIYPEYFGIDGNADDIEINKAISSLPSNVGEELLLVKTYTIENTIEVKSYTRLIGQGSGTKIQASPSFLPASPKPMIETMDDHYNTEIAYIYFKSNGSPNIYGWHGYNGSYHNWIHHSYFDGFRSVSVGAVDPSGSNRNIITNNIFYNCSVGYFATDTNRQYGNIVSDNSFYDCQSSLRGSYPFQEIWTNNYIRSSVDYATGISIMGNYNSEGMLIAHNIIYLSGASDNWAAGISLNTGSPAAGRISRMTIQGNTIRTSYIQPVKIWGNADKIIFTDNIFYYDSGSFYIHNYNALNPNHHIEITNNQFHGGMSNTALLIDAGQNDIVIKDNHFFNYHTGIDIAGLSNNTLVLQNIFTNVSTAISDRGSASLIQRNIGYSTENSGTASISSGNIYVLVPHGLNISPSLSDISVVATNNMGSALKFWISDVSSSSFRINVDQDPQGEASFSWQINSY